MNRFAFIVPAFFLVACVQEPERLIATPSGRPEARFNTTNTAAVAEKLTSLCAKRGHIIQVSSPSQVVCGGQMEEGQAILAQVMIGNSYSTTPEQYIRFTIFKEGQTVRVQAYQWIETQMAFGQVKKVELNDNAQFNSVIQALQSIGGTPVNAG